VTPASVVWSYSGVRPLLDDDTGDPSAVTRDYQLELQATPAPLMSVWGGKITTFRKLAEQAADQLCDALHVRAAPWTERAVLPGGDLSAWITPSGRPDTDIARFQQALATRRPELTTALCRRWARSYGSLVQRLLDTPNLGRQVAPDLYEAELRYLCDHEWAREPDDVLWRRSKLGLHFNEKERAAVADWFERRDQECHQGVRLSAI
jgi:glycerol-3-phosphate dehydrogenase